MAPYCTIEVAYESVGRSANKTGNVVSTTEQSPIIIPGYELLVTHLHKLSRHGGCPGNESGTSRLVAGRHSHWSTRPHI